MALRRLVKSFVEDRGYQLRRKDPGDLAFEKTDGRAIFFLHIGKNAGSQIKRLTKQMERRADSVFVALPHDRGFGSLPRGARYFFSIRNPITRFKSGFYSRMRKGAPRYDYEWSAHERAAFERFEHANDLAEALFLDDESGIAACAAALSITHTAMHQVDWFSRAGFALEQNPPIWIIRQEHFSQDFAKFLERASLDLSLEDLDVSEDRAGAHKTNYSQTPDLSEAAIANLKRWYARDFEFYRQCEHWMQRNN